MISLEMIAEFCKKADKYGMSSVEFFLSPEPYHRLGVVLRIHAGESPETGKIYKTVVCLPKGEEYNMAKLRAQLFKDAERNILSCAERGAVNDGI